MDIKKEALINKIWKQGHLTNENWVVLVESYPNVAHRLADERNTTIGAFRALIRDGKIDHLYVVRALKTEGE